jgi:hypothetical protein
VHHAAPRQPLGFFPFRFPRKVWILPGQLEPPPPEPARGGEGLNRDSALVQVCHDFHTLFPFPKVTFFWRANLSSFLRFLLLLDQKLSSVDVQLRVALPRNLADLQRRLLTLHPVVFTSPRPAASPLD